MRLILFFLKCLVALCASIGFLMIAAAIALVVFLSRSDLTAWFLEDEEVPEAAVLSLDLADGILEARPGNPLARASLGDTLVLREGIEALEAAARDPRIKGLVVRLGRGEPGMAQVQELRDAVRAFAGADKFTVAFAETFGERGDGTLHYYLASAFERVWVQPSGDLDLVGMSLQSPFLREALDDIGVLPRLDHREEYKGASNTFTDRSMPPPLRENLQRLADSWLGQIVEGVAEARGLQPAALRGLIDGAPYKAPRAKELGLVDELGYWDQVSSASLERAGAEAGFIALNDYARLSLEAAEDAPVVALIHGLGPVVLDGSRDDPVFDELAMGSDTVAEAISDALEDEEVQAILFRVNSPGGSYVASDAIWREVVRAREQGVPLIVSMGDVAASGGYFVAAAAHKIVAQPGTVTGSIGVVSGKFVLEELWDDIGIQWDAVRAGRNADIWSLNRDFTPQQWLLLQRSLDAIYEDFTEKVAEGRGLSRERTLAAAKGQVWSGQDALQRGLVDSLGGYSQALALAREAAGIDSDQPLRLRPFPDQLSPFEAFLEGSFGVEASLEDSALGGFARALARVYQAVSPLLRVYDEVTADPRSRQLSAPDAVAR